MRTTGVTPMFQVPKRSHPSARVWVTILLCALLPPLGLIVLWRGLRCPIRGKILVSALALLSMTLMLTTYISFRENSGILIPKQAAGQFAMNDYSSSAGASVSVVRSDAAASPQPTAAPEQAEATPAPANPFE